MTAMESSVLVNKQLGSSLEKLSSGLRINKAADDASGMAIADKLRTQPSSLGQSISNANSANALVQIADKAMAEQSNILDIVKQKLIQASTSTTSAEGRDAIRKDITKLLSQLDNIASQTNYNGINLLDTKGKPFTFQVGEFANNSITATTAYAANTSGLGGGSEEIATGTNIDAGGTMQIVGKTVELKDTDVNASGTDSTGTAGLNITVSGKVGKFTAEVATTVDLSKESADTKAAITAMVANMTTGATLSGDTLTITSGSSMDFKDIELSAATVKSAAASKITLNDGGAEDSTFTVINNNDITGTSGEVNITSATAMTGGKLLSDLKNLAEDGLTSDVAESFMATIDEALSQLNTVRSDFGSTQNQLDSFIRNAMTTQTNIKAAESVIRDVDYAAESANFNKQNIIAQAGTFALSQANNVQQNILKLLQ